jgi:hypothetical protein
MKLIAPGFPREVGHQIDLPDIGELLFAPFFQGISADDYLNYATDFQKSLFARVPLRNDRRYVTVRSGVWLLEPGTRSHVNRFGDWHIDGLLNKGFRERYHILSSSCTALTEFNCNALEEEFMEGETYNGILNRLAKEARIRGQAILPNRIYTFDDHIHRAVDPGRIEFRFFFRVQESDDAPPTAFTPLPRLKIRCCLTGTDLLNIEQHADRVSITMPRNLIDT